MSLEAQLQEAYTALSIPEDRKRTLSYWLGLLNEKHVPTYEHCIRVALTALRAAEHLNLDKNAFFYAGLLHDVGKLLIPKELLEKQEKFNEKDMEIMKMHPIFGYFILKETHPFSAEIALRHHMHKPRNPYPELMPKNYAPLDQATEQLATFYSKIFSLIDFYDAIKTRDNDKYGNQKLNPVQIKERILTENPTMHAWVDALYFGGIFS